MKAAARIAVFVLIGPLLTSLWGGCPQDGSKESPESALRVEAITPDSGPTAGGTRVTIRGGPFQENVGVLFGAHAGVDPIIVNSRMITVSTPPQDAGVVNVSVLTDLGFVNVLGGFTYEPGGPTVDDGTDTDGDGISDVQEEIGWEVWTEMFGLQLGVDTFGNVTRYAVTSDPTLVDTDGDGLNDNVEMMIRSDPRTLDTDDDGLWDGEEWNQWLTSPTAVDTDADARGDRNFQNAPNQALFDGAELFDLDVLRLPPGDPLRVVKARATSPTLMDTDGDDFSDFDEFDSTIRNGVLADLPRLDYELVGDVDVRLDVEYAESIGQTREYGTTLSESESTTLGSSFSNTLGWSLEVMVGYTTEASLFPKGTIEASITAGLNGEYTWTSSTESTRESAKEFSRMQSDSKEFTETAADGSIRTAVLLKNPGNTTFTLSGLSILVMQREKVKPGGDTSVQTPVKTIATMSPSFETQGLNPVRPTLAPGETAGPFELAATGVNAQVIKDLLARPDTLLLGTASMNFQDEDGLDFDFVRQYTIAQTANIVIDFGDGQVRNYNVATNVDRNPDSTYRGITLRRVFEEMLGLPFGDPENGYTTMPSAITGHATLQSLLGRAYVEAPGGEERAYWTVMTSNPDHVNFDLNDVVLRAGDSLHLMFQRDDDGDGLNNTLEKAAGTDQEPVSPGDADGDGLSDKFEVIDGWIAFEDPANPAAPHPDGFEKRRVFSDPRSPDADKDGLSDAQEFAARSDPSDPDSDGDTLIDGQDPFPIRRAGIRFVKADASAGGNGRTWAAAYTTIQQALADAAAGQATPALPDDDVAQVWVARGEYRPSSRLAPIALLNNVSIYGGFSGPGETFAGETKRGQRLTNAFANGCVITGDLAGNDIGEIDLAATGTRAENCPIVVAAGPGLNSSAVLDGFMITGAYNPTLGAIAGALNSNGAPLIQNCLFFKNGNIQNGAGISITAGRAVFKKCTVAENAAQAGGGVAIANPTHVVFEDCEFTQNEARLFSDDRVPNGGGAHILGGGRVDFTRCSFTGNQAHNKGGGIFAEGVASYVRVDSCRFYDNLTTGFTAGDWRGSGAGVLLDADASVSNSVFWGNRSTGWGCAIVAFRRCTITNCTVAFNRVEQGLGAGILTGTRGDHSGNVTIENTISWANWFGSGPPPEDSAYTENLNVLRWDSAVLSVRNSCFNAPSLYRGNNNIGEDPSFMGLELGDLRIDGQSACIDRGNTFVDLDPLVAGLQALPELDFFGKPRIVDGNGDGFVAVDMGAFEAQPQ